MSPKTGLYLDSSEFDKEFYDLVQRAIPKDAKLGLYRAMNEVLRDSIELPPQAPKLIGDLWGSTAGTVKIKEKNEKLSVSGGFNIKYARRHHEVEPGTYDYTLTKGAKHPGPKFMQSKMARYAKKYMQIIADVIRRGR